MTTPEPSPKPRLFALIIGINYYDNAQSLRGAVPDALSFKEYLEKRLGVPTQQIHTLLNKSASRTAIIEAFQNLRDDERIQKGDPIFIYYAGHGSELPSQSEVGSKVQVLVPQDYCAKPEKKIPAIPDRTIAVLIAQIAEKKGDNIVKSSHFLSLQKNTYIFCADPCIRLLPLCIWYQR
jgi:hypothetical protein